MSANTLPKRELLSLVKQLMAIPGPSGKEEEILAFIVEKLTRAGLAPSAMTYDDAHKKSPYGGEVGNLIVKLPGTFRAPRRMMLAHVDTVPLCVGCQPIVRGDRIVPRSSSTAVGADNRSGVGVVLSTALAILERNLPHPPLTFAFMVQEEVGLVGARHLAVNKLGKPEMAFNFDGGTNERLIVGATGATRMQIEIDGIAAHAGAHPEDGASALVVAAEALASVHQEGWHGLVQKGRKKGTSNVGILNGGSAVNVVPDHASVRAEARSHDAAFRERIVNAYRKAFNAAAKGVRNAAKKRASVQFSSQMDYEAFRLDKSQECLAIAKQVLTLEGLDPDLHISDGGLDANWLNAHGIPTVTLGGGQHNAHTVREFLDIDEYLRACTIGLSLAVPLDEEF
ncbi:Peptidase T [Planctomycetes bacterium Pan216]|uniref:Peptidase T n=1 Tax=Kolteria novifilia TaxID=2527975 RepID=A0A518B393_9BACT|nr:Peptidase T [Planctomycetes bacterium Pan216]